MSEHCGYVVKIKELRFHENADRLQIATIFGNSVIVGLDTYVGQMGIYFPVDLQLSEDYCRVNDLVRRKDENGNTAGGYLDPGKRNVRAMRLRGEKSEGLFMPLTSLAEFCNTSELREGDTIDVINGVEICRKYIPVRRNSGGSYGGSGQKKAKKNFAPTFYEHIDTEQLAYHLGDFHHGDTIELTLKMHGTSGRTGYLPLVKQKPQNWLQKLLHRPVQEYKEYDYVTGTRRVVLTPESNGGYYDTNEFRRAMAQKFEGKLRKGEVVYYEIVGFVNKDTPIMGSVANSKVSDKEFTKQYGKTTVFSYGCDPEDVYEAKHVVEYDLFDNKREYDLAPRCEVYVYRMTMVNEDGDVIEYSPDQMRYRCEQMGVKTVPVFERFIIPEYVEETTVECEPQDFGEPSVHARTIRTNVDPGEYVLHKVEQYYDGPDPVGKTHIREGVVTRIVNRNNFAVYKHKNFHFKVLEGIAKDVADAPDMEEAQDVVEE